MKRRYTNLLLLTWFLLLPVALAAQSTGDILFQRWTADGLFERHWVSPVSGDYMRFNGDDIEVVDGRELDRLDMDNALFGILDVTRGGTGQNNAAAAINSLLNGLTSTRGSIAYRGSSSWTSLSPGTAGYVLQSNGPGSNLSWAEAAAVESNTAAIVYLEPPTNEGAKHWTDVILKASTDDFLTYEVFLHTGDREQLVYADQTTHDRLVVEVVATGGGIGPDNVIDSRRYWRQLATESPIGSYMLNADGSRVSGIRILIEDSDFTSLRPDVDLRWVALWLDRSGTVEADAYTGWPIWRPVHPQWEAGGSEPTTNGTLAQLP